MEDYFDIDAILSAEPRVYVTFLVEGKGLGHLGDQDEPDIPQGARVALPFWLVESLAERKVVSVALPRCYTGATRASLRADATAVDLYSACPRYFALGVRVARLLHAPSLAPMLLVARAARAWRAVDAGAHGVQSVLRRLDIDERGLFFASRANNVARARWVERRSERLKVAPGIRNAQLHGHGLKRRQPPADLSPVTPRAAQRTRVR